MAEVKKRRWFARTIDDRDTSSDAPAAPIELTVDASDESAVVFSPRPPAPADQAGPTVADEDLAAIFARLADYLHVQVRSGVYDGPGLRALAIEAAASETPDAQQADEWARQVLSEQVRSWHADADRWGSRTDCDRLDQALARLAADGVLVLAGLLDDESLAESIRVRSSGPGCVCYLVSDIWRAIDVNSLNLTVLDETGHAAPRSAPVVHQLNDALSAAGLLATDGADDGVVEVAMVWRRRPPG